MQCATHPDVETELGCSRCGKAICPRCLVHTPVGARCRECANIHRVPTYNVGTGTLARAIGGAAAAGIVLGTAWFIFDPITYIFFGLIVALVLGTGVGEAVLIATNRRAGPPLQAAAAGGVVLAYLVRISLLFAFDWNFVALRFDVVGLIATGIAIFIAIGRTR